MLNAIYPDPGSDGAVLSVQVGPVAPLGPEEVPSGFVKSPMHGPVAVGRLGLVGDAQADLTVHGGPDKAVYCYPVEHYAAWRAELPEHAAVLQPGGFGENLTTSGLNEDSVCIGDIVRIGSALLQVTQFRQPCFKLALRFADNRLPKAMLRSGRSGWYASVLEEGTIVAGDRIVLVQRPNPAWPVSRLLALLTRRSAALEEMVELANMPGLAANWRATARAAVERAALQQLAPTGAGGAAVGLSS
jgi:MOSC domain-containing protein YiiM